MARLVIGALILVVAAFVLLKLVVVPTSAPAKARSHISAGVHLGIDTSAMEQEAPRHLPVENHPLH